MTARRTSATMKRTVENVRVRMLGPMPGARRRLDSSQAELVAGRTVAHGLIGGELCLDFANTVSAWPRPAYDYLASSEDIAEWERASRAFSSAELRLLPAPVGSNTVVVLAELRALQDPWPGCSARMLRVRGVRRLPRILERAEVAALWGALRTGRDRAMVQAMVLGGLRRCEVLGLRLEELRLGEWRVFIADGKGGHQRLCRCRRASSRPSLPAWMSSDQRAPGRIATSRC